MHLKILPPAPSTLPDAASGSFRCFLSRMDSAYSIIFIPSYTRPALVANTFRRVMTMYRNHAWMCITCPWCLSRG